MVQIQITLLIISCTLTIFGGILIIPSYAQDVSTPQINFTHFFGCKKISNYECEIISNGFKSYALVGNRTKGTAYR